ncbi:phosphotransferase [Ramlibacter sp. AN1015]|uniref:phosphotransferase family protein n=1 Tax=Ramlibacter sp. AN1015 TaxID=3133428 RepID=UPI0030C4864B
MEMHHAIAQDCLALGCTTQLQSQPLRGGLESAVTRVFVRPAAPSKALPRSVVVKELLGPRRREADVYQLLWSALPRPPAARMHGRRDTPAGAFLCLEDVRSVGAWPWRDFAAALEVCQTMARIHRAELPCDALPPWDYETHLRKSAQETLALARSVVTAAGVPVWPQPGGLARVVAALPRMRERLRGGGVALIHGDVHPGNVLVRAAAGADRVVLIDWAASRVGSPLEDLASWLHSLGCWEAEARRRHDTLLSAYLRASGAPGGIGADLRARYWMASACNGLAGAIRFHIAVLGDVASGARARKASQRALDEWRRAIRRADAVLRHDAGAARRGGRAPRR